MKGSHAIPDSDVTTSGEQSFERLERLVRSLVDKYRVLLSENASLREDLEGRETRIRSLDDQIREMNQSRQDAAKRIDDLIAQIDHVDARLGASSND